MTDHSGDPIRRRAFAQHAAVGLAALVSPVRYRTAAVASPSPEPDVRSRLPAMARFVSDAVPGFAVAAIVEGRVAWSDGLGVKAAGGSDPVTATTIFEAASLSKPVTAYAVLRLRDEGRIDLDRPLIDYLPYPDSDDPRVQQVTARHVMSHRTGLENYRTKAQPAFLFSPGARYGYSGEGVVWLQRVVEHLTATPFARYLREQVLIPLGMTRSSHIYLPGMMGDIAMSHPERGKPEPGTYHAFGLRALELATRWGKPVDQWTYDDAVRAAREIDPARFLVPRDIAPNGAGSLLTTAGDYALFMTRFMDGADSVVPDHIRREMLTPTTRVSPVTHFGLGWALEEDFGGMSFYHFGGNRGFTSFAVGDPKRRVGMVLLANSEEGPRLNWPVVAEFTKRGVAALLS